MSINHILQQMLRGTIFRVVVTFYSIENVNSFFPVSGYEVLKALNIKNEDIKEYLN